MSEKEIITAPIPTIRRLPRYIHLLTRLKRDNVEVLSTTRIAEELGFEAIQVRKDIAVTGIVGKPKKGYDLDELLNALRHFLNWDNNTDAFLVGVGALGKAILGYSNFKSYGLNVLAAFDSDINKIGTKYNGVEIFPVDKLDDLIQRLRVHIGVITVPASEAQFVADLMVKGGVKAIWNFAPRAIKVPSEIILENVHLSQSLAVLTHKLSQMNDE